MDYANVIPQPGLVSLARGAKCEAVGSPSILQ